VPTQLISPSDAERFDIRGNVGDAIVANLAVHLVFFFERHLDTSTLSRAFARALANLPLFAGRIRVNSGRMGIRCEGQGVPFTTVSSSCTMADAIRSASHDDGGWLIDPVNGATARWGWGPLCRVRVTHLADDATAPPTSTSICLPMVLKTPGCDSSVSRKQRAARCTWQRMRKSSGR
jgi:hypothetical protein